MKQRRHIDVIYVAKAILIRQIWKHIEAIHDGKKWFKCDICDYSSFYKSHIRSHASLVHEGKKLFNCDICDCSCSRKSNMNYACCICPWRKEAIQVWYLWLQLFSTWDHESTCIICPWKKQAIQMWNLWLPQLLKEPHEYTCWICS